MNKITLVSSAVSVILLLAAVSCSKSDKPDPAVKPFSVGGISYSTLQQAVDASKDIDCPVIELIQDATGEGAVLDADAAYGLTMDFSSFRYTLAKDCSIIVDGSWLRLTAEGGGLQAVGNTPVLSVRSGGCVTLTGNLCISSDEALHAIDALVETDGFTGGMEGDITLDCAKFVLHDTGCHIDADAIQVGGEGAVLSAETPAGATVSGPVVNIGKVYSTLEHPVVSVNEGVVAIANGDVHIHKLALRTVKGTCVMRDYVEITCNECGYQSFEELDSYGDCPAEYLEHHEAKPATDIEYGNVEYWECPFCHKVYAKSDGTEEFIDGIFIMPEAYMIGSEILNESGFQAVGSPLPVAGFIIGAISLMNGIWGTVDRLMGKEESHNWTFAFQNLDQIKFKLEVVDSKIDKIYREIKDLPCKMEVSDRNTVLWNMKSQTYLVDSLICKFLKDTVDTPKETVKRKIRSVIKYWGESTYKGVSFIDCTKSLMQRYCSGFLGRDFPEMWGVYVNGLYPWEHQGYDFRSQIMLNDVAYLSVAWCLTVMYYNEIKQYDNQDLCDVDVEELKKIRDAYSATCKGGLNRMQERDEKYRRLNPFDATFYRKPTVNKENMHKWFLAHKDKLFPRDNRDNKAVESCEDYLEAYGLKDLKPMTQKQAKFIYDYHNKGKKGKERQTIYSILRDTVGFIDCPDHYLTRSEAIYLGDDTGFRSLNRDINQPAYKMLAWTTRGSDDLFGFHTILRPEATTDTQGIIHGRFSADGRLTVSTMHMWTIYTYHESNEK